MISECSAGAQNAGIIWRDAVFGDHTFAAFFRQLRQRRPNLLLPFGIDDQWQEVWFGKVAVIMRFFFGAHAVGFTFIRVVKSRLLHNLFPGFDDFDLALKFVLQRFADKAEGVHILHLGFSAEFLLPSWTDTYVGIAPQRALFHIAIAHTGVEDDFFEPAQVLIGFIW